MTRPTLVIARWEFRRFFKPKQLLIGLLFTFGGLGIGVLIGRAGTRAGEERAEVPVVNVPWSDAAWASAAQVGNLDLIATPPEREPALRARVEAGELDAYLIADGDGAYRIVARRPPAWRPRLERAVATAQGIDRMLDSGLDEAQIARVAEPPAIRVERLAAASGAAERIAGIAAVVVIVLGTMTAMGYIFQSITAEKQNRVAEQIISAVSPQQWMDGKILGLAGVTLVSVVNLLLGFVVLLVALRLFGVGVTIPASVANPALIALFFAFMLLGFLFWLIFLAVVAAMIDDPNNSNRTQLLMLPVLASATAILVLLSPDTTLVRVLSLVPPTSAAVMPARLLLADVAWLEWVGAIVLLAASLFVMRRVAGRVFHLVMLLYGKEPSWSEVRRWASVADAR